MKKIIAIAGFFSIIASGATSASAAYFNTDPIYRCDTQITQTLQMGNQSGQVGLLQGVLVNAGYLQAVPNGYYGHQTREAVRAFQIDNQIRSTGIVGEATRNALNERMCDSNLLDNVVYFSDEYSDVSYAGSYDGTTYVTNEDPFVRVITPAVSAPVIYNTPQFSPSGYPLPFDGTPVNSPVVTPSVYAQPTAQISSTNIVYNPSTGYTYGIVPQSGSITVGSPLANAVYNEGDTVNVAWATRNLPATPISISLESTISGQKVLVGTTNGTSYSFVLTKQLLDSVCGGVCDNYQQGSFRVVVSAPTTDIAGINSNLRAAISPITIRRPFPMAQVSISASKTPVNSGEVLRLYVNIPQSQVWNAYQYGSYSFRIKAVCTNNVQVSIAGTPCGQEFSMPASMNNSQQEIPAVINNGSWYKQDVRFIITAINTSGQTIGTAETVVSVNAAPFNW